MDIKKILSDNGITENIDKLEDLISKEIGKSFVPKTQYNKKVQALDTLAEEKNEIEAKLQASSNSEDAQKLADLQQEFDNYKNNIETKQIVEQKTSKLTESLKTEGFNDKIISLLTKEFDIDNIEIEEDKIKNWEELVKPVKESYADFISNTVEVGAGSITPPANNNTGADAFLAGFDSL